MCGEDGSTGAYEKNDCKNCVPSVLGICGETCDSCAEEPTTTVGTTTTTENTSKHINILTRRHKTFKKHELEFLLRIGSY